jgi:hypothetical protein
MGVYITSPSWLPRSTTLAVSPSNYATQSGVAVALTATVKYGSAQVSGGTISWQATGGSLNQNTGTTVIFTAPTVTSNQTYTITVSFGGTGVYQASSATAHVTVSPPKAEQTVLTVNPSVFELHGGDTLNLNAALTPVGAPTDLITWSIAPANVGSLSATTGASVTYTAPQVQQNTSVTITAAFAGDSAYLGSSGSSAGVVTPPSLLQFTYTLTFNSASMSGVTLIPAATLASSTRNSS